MKGRMLKHLISFWWWVVDNGGVCGRVCVCGGGYAGIYIYKHHSRRGECVERVWLLLSQRLSVLPD